MRLTLLRKLMPAIAVNALLALLFVVTNYSIWDWAGSSTSLVQLVSYSPFWINVVPLGPLENHQLVNIALVKGPTLNFPFWLFFLAIAVNLCFMARFASKKPSSSL